MSRFESMVNGSSWSLIRAMCILKSLYNLCQLVFLCNINPLSACLGRLTHKIWCSLILSSQPTRCDSLRLITHKIYMSNLATMICCAWYDLVHNETHQYVKKKYNGCDIKDKCRCHGNRQSYLLNTVWFIRNNKANAAGHFNTFDTGCRWIPLCGICS